MKSLRCLFGHSWNYLASYMRVCKRCTYERAGWGKKKLSPGDDFEKLRKSLGIVNPDSFRKIK